MLAPKQHRPQKKNGQTSKAVNSVGMCEQSQQQVTYGETVSTAIKTNKGFVVGIHDESLGTNRAKLGESIRKTGK